MTSSKLDIIDIFSSVSERVDYISLTGGKFGSSRLTWNMKRVKLNSLIIKTLL